ncbi:MAG: MFS transporter, partial [Blastocatellia bacterium]|nr:MFS transporter [Blastocatellia bacterium]
MSFSSKRPIRHLRWYIAILICFASELNYMDRNTLSVLKVTIQKALNFDDNGYALITATFLWTYAVGYLLSGMVVDRLGSRKGYLFFVSGWSLANMLHAFATGVGSFQLFRGLLAAMEPANFPAGVKAVSEWFPLRERALAVGIFNAGTALGNTLAVPVAAAIALRLGWQAAFVFTGAIGFAWVATWYFSYHLPQEHPRISAEEKELILAGREEDAEPDQEKPSLGQLLKVPATWGCALARLLTDPISYFLFFWTPSYLEKERGFNLKEVGMYAWIPFAALTLGNIFSGAMPRFLISRGWSLNSARKTTMLGVSLAMLALCFLVTKATSPVMAVLILAAVMFGHAAWGNIILPAEAFHKNAVGTVTGFGGFLGGVAGGVTQLVIGSVVTKYGYAPIFAGCSVMYLIALACVHLLIGELGVMHKVPTPNSK